MLMAFCSTTLPQCIALFPSTTQMHLVLFEPFVQRFEITVLLRLFTLELILQCKRTTMNYEHCL